MVQRPRLPAASSFFDKNRSLQPRAWIAIQLCTGTIGSASTVPSCSIPYCALEIFLITLPGFPAPGRTRSSRGLLKMGTRSLFPRRFRNSIISKAQGRINVGNDCTNVWFRSSWTYIQPRTIKNGYTIAFHSALLLRRKKSTVQMVSGCRFFLVTSLSRES